MKSTIQPESSSDFDIAIIGMAGRFPRANSVAEFWDNLLEGKDCIGREHPLLTREKGCEVVRAFGAIDRPFHFDNEFFGVSPQDAQTMEPQERILLQCAYEALEDAGCNFQTYPGKIGIVCGAQENEYYLEDRYVNKRNNPLLVETEKITNAGTSLCSRISYKLNLTGPSLIVSTACASSLSAVHLGARMLQNYDAGIMLAGGANVSLNQSYYFPIEGMISREGVVRAFDKKGRGLVPGNGVGLVVLKRLKEAILEGDHIYAVIKGSAMGNDGNRKIGFAAPSLQGEYEVIREALDFAQLQESEIDYIETHGTGTPLGDAVEIRALSRIFAGKVPTASLPIGSLKSNCGHLNIAAGIAGLIKAALVLKYKTIPPSLHHVENNEELSPDSPLYVVKQPLKLEELERKRHAGVSAFGVGGANAHLILEEYREEDMVQKPEEREELLVFSAKSPQALTEITEKNSAYLSLYPGNVEKAAYTLLTGRKHYQHRNYLVLRGGETVKTGKDYQLKEGEEKKPAEIIFLFPGTGSDYEQMGRDLYRKCEVFRRYFQEGNEILNALTGRQTDLLATREKTLTAAKILICSYSLGRTLMDAGVRPAKLIGHSLGEYTLAALAEVITLEEAVKLVYQRAKLIAALPGGKLISVAAEREKLEELLGQRVHIAAVNAPKNTLLVCLEEDFPSLESSLKEKGYRYVVLNSDMPAHSPIMEGIAQDYAGILAKIPFRTGKFDLVSSYLGREVNRDELSRPGYWLEQMINPVNFSQAIQEVLTAGDREKVFIEVGPGNQLVSLVKRNLKAPGSAVLLDIMRSGKGEVQEWRGFLTVLGELWKTGQPVDLANFYAAGQKKKVSLPTYSFQLREFNVLKQTCRTESRSGAEERQAFVNLNPGRAPEVDAYVRKEPDLEGRGVGQAKDSALVIQSEDFAYFKELERKQDQADNIRRIQDYPGLNETYWQLCLSGAAAYFRRQGPACQVSYSIPELIARWGVLEDYREFVMFLMSILTRWGYAKIEGERIVFFSQLEEINDLEAECQKACREQPQFAPYIHLFHTCAASYDQVFRGKVEGNSILYPEGNFDFLNSVDEQIPNLERTWTYIRLLPALVRHLTGKTQRRIRILEVGGGTGLITWPLLEALPAEQVEYYFTDIGPSFVAQAEGEAKQRKLKNVKFSTFDVEKPFSEAGFLAEQFDLVVGFDVLQATANLKKVMENLYQVLKNNGLMIMLQSFWLHDIVSMIYGFAPGWWNFQKDEERRGTALAFPAPQWEYFFHTAGLTNIHIVSGGYDGTRNDAGLIMGNKLSPVKDEITRANRGDYLEEYAQEIVALPFEDLREKSLKQSPEPKASDPSLSGAEEEIIALVQEIVGEKNIRLEEDLYDIGVDSLSILIIKAKLQKSFRCDLSVKEIFACRTIKKFAALVAERQGELNSDMQPLQSKHQGPPQSESQAKPQLRSLADLFNKVKTEAQKA
ncbi:type I polyketide synthase [Desulfosporosinus shakirovi]|uniref:type I polyketide synthase n=1 Tax=Desulfosporosinus shakirovi TaxID=2885154 RepID=UPI001E30312C|nr:type I polyketide synthase [Desulfosporosinus sp. SRJS8]MCB8816721.1 acyltransferase domain-containing protein [Desulfosporosinus sp. SRJS8]